MCPGQNREEVSLRSSSQPLTAFPGPAGERQPAQTEFEKSPDGTSALSHDDVPLSPAEQMQSVCFLAEV